MAGIYSLFEQAAKLTEKIPWRYRLLAGAGTGAGLEAAFGDPNRDIMDRLAEGLFIGGTLGLGAGAVTRVIGRGADLAGTVSQKIAGNRMAAFQTRFAANKAEFGFFKGVTETIQRSPFATAGIGAAAGYAIAPEGHKMQGLAIGAGIGVATPYALGAYRGFEAVSKLPGGTTGLLIAGASVPLAAMVATGYGPPASAGAAVPGVGGTIDYEPMEGDMRDRMTAMNASGDIVLGLNGRRHG